ncbi:hypothetical protein [Priestia megaterium]|nr:hypothetical protein [Priestia megaterium]
MVGGQGEDSRGKSGTDGDPASVSDEEAHLPSLARRSTAVS